MGAGARQRGDRAIRQRFADESIEQVSVTRLYLSGLHASIARHEKRAEAEEDRRNKTEADLRRATALIMRLRAENEVLKVEKRKFLAVVDAAKRHIAISGNAQKKWAVMLVRSKLAKARLI